MGRGSVGEKRRCWSWERGDTCKGHLRGQRLAPATAAQGSSYMYIMTY